jgi:hypothetical protein
MKKTHLRMGFLLDEICFTPANTLRQYAAPLAAHGLRD